jgi:hypothetical protein
MKKLKYIGKLGNGVCEPRSGRAFSFAQGATVEVPERVASELVKGAPSEWREVKGEKSQVDGVNLVNGEA